MTEEAVETVVTIEEGEQTVELLAASIEDLADAAEKLLDAGLTRRGLVVLLQDRTGLGKREINAVLDALPQLRRYVK